MRFEWLLVGVSLAFAGPASGQATRAPAAEVRRDWRATTVGDVNGAYDIFVANHPGPHDPLQPHFIDKLREARDAGLVIARQAKDREDYGRALGAFTATLGDGHARVFPTGNSNAATRQLWPGFVAAWRGEGMIVQRAGAGFPAPTGSAILSCDGGSVRDLVKRRLLSGLRASEGGQWWSRAPQAFMAFEGYTADAPKTCRFRTPAGAVRTLRLNWTAAPADYRAWLSEATDGDRTPIGLSEPRAGIFLIGMPTFSPTADEVKAYRALFETLAQRRSQLKRARAVVIDLRYNDGGSSSWSRDAAQALWGKDAVDQRLQKYFEKVRIWWRASPGNSAYMSQLEANLRRDGNSEVADAVHTYGLGMKTALAKGEPFFVEADDESEKPLPKVLAATDFKTPVYVITPGRCASACLDAVDTFKLFPNVKLIGAPTSGDSTYMEVRLDDLPSGQGKAVIPMKIWMNRPRGSGQVYQPDIMVTEPDWSTRTFLNRIAADLRKR